MGGLRAMRTTSVILLVCFASQPCWSAPAPAAKQSPPELMVGTTLTEQAPCPSAASGPEGAGDWLDEDSGWASSGTAPCTPGCRLCPAIYGWVEGVFLERSNGSQTQPVVVLMPVSQTLVSTTDLQFGFAPGLRALLGAQLLDGWAIESSYLALFGAQSTAFVLNQDSENHLALPGGSNLFSHANEMRVSYSSQLHTVDLNLVHCRCCCEACGDGPLRCQSFQWLAGFRYLNLTEAFGIVGRCDSCPPRFSFDYDIHTRNNLYGAQLGARYRRCRGRWSWEATGKAGVYLNDAQQTQQIVDLSGFSFRDSNAAGGHAAFVGEVNLSGIYRLTDVWGLRAGYNLIGISGVALAPDQLDFSSDPTTAGRQLDRTGGLLLHGVNFGLEARW